MIRFRRIVLTALSRKDKKAKIKVENVIQGLDIPGLNCNTMKWVEHQLNTYQLNEGYDLKLELYTIKVKT